MERASKIRSSNPSKRPHSRITPSPPASSRTRAWVSGAPRGVNASIGRPSATLPGAAASTSGRSTIPAPPPAGVSSTLRCLSVAKSRMLVASRLQMPSSSARPARLVPSGPGNMSGYRVRTEARKVIAEPPLSQSIGPRMDGPILDCLIVGGGPAGLTAAIYLARFHLDILLVDGGKSRAASIPCTRNHAGYPDGIEGKELLKRMRDQACKYGAKIESELVTKLERDEEAGLFTATWGSGSAVSRSVLLATGVANRRPPMDEELHDDGLSRGLVRYCPICDGYEVTDKRVGVIGSDSHGVAEALFLRSYTADLTLIAPDKAMRLKPEDFEKL